jgi:hypothetical protein
VIENHGAILEAVWSLAGQVDRNVYTSAVLAVSGLDAQVFAGALLDLVRAELVYYDLTTIRLTQRGYQQLHGEVTVAGRN